MQNLDIFYRATEDIAGYVKGWKADTKKPVMGYFCSYTPEEFIYASGSLPVRIFGTDRNITLADSHLQPYCCSLVRGGLEDALAGRLDYLDGTVFPHTCDSIQRLSDIWRLNARMKIHIDVILPVKLNTPSSREYMTDVFRKFKRDLESSLGIQITDDGLRSAIELYNRIRGSLKKIYQVKSRFPEIMSGRDLFTIIKAGMVMDRDRYAGALETLSSSIEGHRGNEKSGLKRIFIAGGICNHPDIYSLMEASGGTVVWDELCTGTRFFEGEIRDSPDPAGAIAERYMDRIICPVKHRALDDRGENLVTLAKAHNAAGVVFLFLKFCDPQGFDYPYLKNRLDKEGIPNMLLEIEEGDKSMGQMKTRIESFIEMLK